jgi:hypothetical protein
MSRRSRFFIDIALLIGLLVANAPARTGIAVHEWLSFALIVPLLVHLVVNWEWTVHVTRRFFERLMSVSRLNLLVDVALFAFTVTVMVSGLAVSSVVPGLLGFASAASPLWVAVHSASASATIIALLAHFALHGTWFAQTITALLDGRGHAARPARTRARSLQRTLSVLGVTAVLVVAILLTVGATGVLLDLDGTSAITSTTVATSSDSVPAYGTTSTGSTAGVRTCPRTGCTASTCHAETGQSPYAQ